MPIVKMDRMTLVGLADDRDAVIDALMHLGAIEVIPQPAAEKPETGEPVSLLEDSLSQTQNSLSRLERAIALAKKIDPKKKPLFTLRRAVTAEKFSGTAERERQIMDQVSQLERNQALLDDLHIRQHRLSATNELITPWIDFDLDLSIQGTEHVRYFLGSLDHAALIGELESVFQEEAPETMILPLDSDINLPGSLRVIIAVWLPRAAIVQSHLRRLSFNPLPLQGESGTPRQIFSHNEAQLAEIADDMERVTSENQVLAASLEDFETLYDNLTIRLDRLQEIARLSSTRSTFWLDGWIPSNLVAAVTDALSSRFTLAAQSRPALPDEEYPVLLKNPRLIKPFEVVGEMFSPPSRQDSDPSPWVAPFYFFFFGIMLSDVAYGLILTAICAFIIYKVKVQGDFRRMSTMLMYCGISSTIWGFLFGGFFGDMLSVLSGGSLIMPAIWFNPMDDPTALMVWSIVFGVIHLFAGMFANALNLVRAGRWQDAVFDILPWYLIIIGIGLLFAGPMLLPALGQAGQIMAIAGVAIILLFGGRPAKNPIVRLFKGLGALYNITAYLSDILSYTRILALVLATSVIAMVVNLMGFMLGPTIPGILVFIIVAIAGHGLNLALSALSAYVHTSRLHYVEFFGKFYQGGGRMWKPLMLKTKYTQISRVLPAAGQAQPKA